MVLTRKNDEAVVVGGLEAFERMITITVVESKNGRVRLGFQADADIPVHRFEVWERICGETVQRIRDTALHRKQLHLAEHCGTRELFCVVKSNISVDGVLKGEPNEWATLRWTDEFGNSIAPFFTSLESSQPFLKEMNGWQLKRYPVSFVVEVILADIKQETSFYTIDPASTEKFKALNPVQFLTELIYRKHPMGIETQDLVAEHADIVPIEALFGEGRDPNAEVEYRRLLAVADLIFGVDVKSGKQSIVFGRLPLEELVRTGQSNILGVVNVGLDQETMELEKLATLVQDIKGHHDYYGAAAV